MRQHVAAVLAVIQREKDKELEAAAEAAEKARLERLQVEEKALWMRRIF